MYVAIIVYFPLSINLLVLVSFYLELIDWNLDLD